MHKKDTIQFQQLITITLASDYTIKLPNTDDTNYKLRHMHAYIIIRRD